MKRELKPEPRDGFDLHTFRIEGTAPGLLLHNPRSADPNDYYAVQKSKITSKKAKDRTEDDQELLHRLEWESGLYLDDVLGDGVTRPVLESAMVESCIISGAKKMRKGPAFKCGLFCDHNAAIEFDGWDTFQALDELWASRQFIDARFVVVNRSRVRRVRPYFREWEATLIIYSNRLVLKPKDVRLAVHEAGIQSGMGDYRPKFGRFSVMQATENGVIVEKEGIEVEKMEAGDGA